MNASEIGLAVHSNFIDVMAAYPVDRYFKNVVALAAGRGMPVIAEYFLGDSSEEIEPLALAHPLVTLRGLKAIADVAGVAGIKEYFGLAPDREDPNLRMTGLFFANPGITEAEAVRQLAAPYGKASGWRGGILAMLQRRHGVLSLGRGMVSAMAWRQIGGPLHGVGGQTARLPLHRANLVQ